MTNITAKVSFDDGFEKVGWAHESPACCQGRVSFREASLDCFDVCFYARM